MEHKIKYQYTYFIHPFIIKENKYQKYILKMLRDKNIRMKIFQKEKDIKTYEYFLPKINKFLFSSFEISDEQNKQIEELAINKKARILSKHPCIIFEYQLPKDIQGKADENCIFFKMQKVEIICFNTGICFLVIKTNVEETNEFEVILNFNYKFRDIKKGEVGEYKNIHLQTDSFSDTSKITDFIKNITGTEIESAKINLDTQRFLSYSYICIDQKMWGANKNFENIESNFIKFSNFLSADNSTNFGKEEKAVTCSKWKYAKLSISKQGVALFSSDADMYNYTILPEEFENVYLYTYILNLYKKIYLKKLDIEFNEARNIINTKKTFAKFTKELWTQECTEDEVGTWINAQLLEKLETEKIYNKVKDKDDVLYKDMKIEKNYKIMLCLVVVLVLTLIFNILKYFN